jgi:BirA family biotin operon repressor/biotin-[acetyl-CoA-carboxylase] ligase
MLAPDSGRRAQGERAGHLLQIDQILKDLATNRLGKKIHYFLKIDSTNSHARRLAERGAQDGEILIAEQQTAGRGRLGREWISPAYVNLYCSVILRPKLPPVHAPQVTLMAAVALADAVASFLPVTPTIKWPNDILVQGKKLAGILTESSCDAEHLEFVILGIGVNLNYPEELMPETIRQHATSALIAGRKTIRREVFVQRLIQDLDRCYGILQESGFGALAPRWEARFGLRGSRVRVELMGGVIFGTARGIDGDGALIVEREDGNFERIVAGDVIPAE